MQLFIKTPLYEHNKYVPHLLEHCVLFSSEREEAFTYFGDINAGTTYGGTEFEFYSPLSLSHLLKKISQPISQETFRIQKKYLAYELKNPIFSQKLREKFMQTVENNSCIRANTLQKGVNLELLTNYQKKWYQEQQMIFVGEDNNVDLQF
ncbi:MAG: hypothetical protein LBP53_03360 [Candidatus Peribacteria bacterium]|jgi:hypothetical protein|nr:hypothetical protein [Candidatus Peribacteria bacterium]